MMGIVGVFEVLINYLSDLSVWWCSLNLAGVSVFLSLHNDFFSFVQTTPKPHPKRLKNVKVSNDIYRYMEEAQEETECV